jgi:TPR repeat protein
VTAGVSYEYGTGVAADKGEAARRFAQAAEQGMAEAQLVLGKRPCIAGIASARSSGAHSRLLLKQATATCKAAASKRTKSKLLGSSRWRLNRGTLGHRLP